MVGLDGEQDQVGCIGVMGAKQMRQSGYGGVLSSAISLDVRSSAFSPAFLYLSADETSWAVSTAPSPPVSSLTNFRPRLRLALFGVAVPSAAVENPGPAFVCAEVLTSLEGGPS